WRSGAVAKGLALGLQAVLRVGRGLAVAGVRVVVLLPRGRLGEGVLTAVAAGVVGGAPGQRGPQQGDADHRHHEPEGARADVEHARLTPDLVRPGEPAGGRKAPNILLTRISP